ncbi:MAG TPA: preprotein translocase subunit SecG [Defluviitaleaceae bacterium]|nr:preprotein translocase subunit SecG [Defluviitaleaceae bacterium]HQD49953.1 preprotein translocase subunit SecG [Defluviitaleaceae bacterium]
MSTLTIVLSVVYVILALILITAVMLQEGKSAGLGTLSGSNSDTFWGKNKAYSLEGQLEKFTKILAVLFIVLAVVLVVLIK